MPRKDVVHFSRQLAVFMKAGIPIMEAMEVILDETTEKLMRKVLDEMIEDLRAGDTFAGGRRRRTPRRSPPTTWASSSPPR